MHVVGVSSLAAGHLTLVPALRAELDALGRQDLMIVVGGVIPAQDFDALRAAGADAIYPPGTVISRAAIDLVARPARAARVRQVDVADLAAGVRAGSRQHVARAITLLESTRTDHRERAAELLVSIADATGGVGAGRHQRGARCRQVDLHQRDGMPAGRARPRVAVVAVDPTSRRTGGSILGDRTRMAELAASEAAFIRPSPSGSQLGGVARATRESMLVLEAAGYDVVIVETVGVGQNEIAVSEMVDTFLLLTLARAGDQLQGIKRGILELADVIAVNKADGDGEGPARGAARELAGAMRMMMPGPATRRPPVLTCSAQTGAGPGRGVVGGARAPRAPGGRGVARGAPGAPAAGLDVGDGRRPAARRGARRPQRRAQRVEVERAVRAGELSAVDGTARILELYVADLRTHRRLSAVGLDHGRVAERLTSRDRMDGFSAVPPGRRVAAAG